MSCVSVCRLLICQAKRIAEAIQSVRPECLELQLLLNRIDLCQSAQRWVTTADLKSLSTVELQSLARKLEEKWPSIPLLQRARFTTGMAGAFINEFNSLQVDEEDETGGLDNIAAQIANILLFEESTPVTWSGVEPSSTALVQEAIMIVDDALSSSVSKSGGGDADPDGGDAETTEISTQCNTALQAGGVLSTECWAILLLLLYILYIYIHTILYYTIRIDYDNDYDYVTIHCFHDNFI